MSDRGTRRSVIGVVTSNKMAKTLVVEKVTRTKHPLYGKYVNRNRKYKAHCEQGGVEIGDRVEITETRPISKTKCWRFVRVVEKNQG
ncbi:MAG TPA: 30S ribosomal protein S17 [Candidatus Brocadiia bacterium]|nr:30S ribosomal protein S17 [Candidatus Brocadiia bacterium]